MLRHATYRRERPFLAFVGDAFAEIVRPSRLALLAFVLIGASQLGVPVARAIPGAVKHGYADGRAWQSRNAAKMVCHSGHADALKSGGEREVAMAVDRCNELQQTYQR